MRKPLTQRVQEAIETHLKPGAKAIDATVGNGHDTLFLAHRVGTHGEVIGFDVQTLALLQTHTRLKAAGLEHRVRLIQASHADLQNHLPPEWAGQIQAVMFNLGYLPGSDKQCTTQTHSTCIALQQALNVLAPDGILSVIAYRGHPGGLEEAHAVAELFQRYPQYQLTTWDSPGPIAYLLRRHD